MKYGVNEGAGVALSVTVSEMEPCGLTVALSVTVSETEPRGFTVAEKPTGSRQFDSRSTGAEMSGQAAAMVRASRCGAGDWP